MKAAADERGLARIRILSNEAARKAYYDEVMARRAAVESEPGAVATGQEVKIENYKLQIPAAEAWMLDHSDDLKPEYAATYGELRRLVTLENARFKAARERFREMGIK